MLQYVHRRLMLTFPSTSTAPSHTQISLNEGGSKKRIGGVCLCVSGQIFFPLVWKLVGAVDTAAAEQRACGSDAAFKWQVCVFTSTQVSYTQICTYRHLKCYFLRTREHFTSASSVVSTFSAGSFIGRLSWGEQKSSISCPVEKNSK